MNSVNPLHVGFLLLDRFTLSAFSTFLDPLRLAADTDDRSRQVRCRWDVMTVDGNPAVSSCGVEVRPTRRLDTPPELSHVVVVGGLINAVRRDDEHVARTLRKFDRNGVSVIGLCTGVFPMIAAGLLNGERCSVNWFHHGDLVERYFEVVPDTVNLYHLGPRHGTCAGGIGAACVSIELIERYLGKSMADKAARILMVPDSLLASPVQPHDHIFEQVADSRVRKALLILERTISDNIAIDEIASELGLSGRQLERRFKQELDMTPMDARTKLRMMRAERLLARTDMKVIDIALECGYATSTRLGTVFKSHYGETPVEYRARHRNTTRVSAPRGSEEALPTVNRSAGA